MDPVENPYAPGAGTPPPELAGRTVVLRAAEIALARMRAGRSTQSPILTGLRGVGKTVLLIRIKELAESRGFRPVMIEAQEGKTLPALLSPSLRQILYALSVVDNAKDKARRGLRVLKSFLSGVRVSIGGAIEIGLDPEVGSADSGDLDVDLSELFFAVGDAARAGGTSIALMIDELQYLSKAEFGALIIAMHRLSQEGLPFLFIGAGLPQIPGTAGDAKSYSERLFTFPKIGALERNDAIKALLNPAREAGVEYTDESLSEILRVTECYPYFLQQWGHEVWNLAAGPRIQYDDVILATNIAIRKLDDDFFRVRFDRCTPSEKRYLRALAELGPGQHRSGDIADVLGMKVTSAGPTRAKLIAKGMIYSPQHGDMAFTVPLFDAYMLRAMPTLS